MLITVEGIVVGKRTIGDNNCFIDVLTDEYGVIEATAHGIKKLTSKNAGACSLFSYSKFCFSKSGLKYTLNSAEPKVSFHRISSDLEGLSLAAYFAEIVKFAVAEEQEAPGFLRFMAVTLYEIEKKRISLTQTKAVFELHISAMLGFSPDLTVCRNCMCYEHEQMFFDPEESCIYCGDCVPEERDGLVELSPDLLYAMRFILYSDTDRIYRFTLTEAPLAALSRICEDYLLRQLDRAFKSLDYYNSIKL